MVNKKIQDLTVETELTDTHSYIVQNGNTETKSTTLGAMCDYIKGNMPQYVMIDTFTYTGNGESVNAINFEHTPIVFRISSHSDDNYTLTDMTNVDDGFVLITQYDNEAFSQAVCDMAHDANTITLSSENCLNDLDTVYRVTYSYNN